MVGQAPPYVLLPRTGELLTRLIVELPQNLHAVCIELDCTRICGCFRVTAKLRRISRGTQVNDLVICKAHAHAIGSVDCTTGSAQSPKDLCGLIQVCLVRA